MAKLTSFPSLKSEDYDAKDRPIITKLAYSLNNTITELQQALNKGLNVTDNLNMAYRTIEVTVDASGTPLTTVNIKTGLSSNSTGIQVIKAVNKGVASAAFPNSTPFISYSENNQIITVSNIAGLPANVKFQLTLLILT